MTERQMCEGGKLLKALEASKTEGRRIRQRQHRKKINQYIAAVWLVIVLPVCLRCAYQIWHIAVYHY